jgi:hypothetical protein
MGGSGSSYLIRALSRRCQVGARPDTVFRLDHPDLRDATVAENGRSFADRAHGYRIPPGAGLEDVLPGYVDHLRRRRRRTAVFNTAAELGLFSKLSIGNVVFVVRHPLHALVSWSKPERHGDLAERLGGAGAEENIRQFARRWNAVADEAEHLGKAGLLGGIVRYEYALTDAEPLGLVWVFRDLDSSRRNWDALDPAAENLLRELVWARYTALYSGWRV